MIDCEEKKENKPGPDISEKLLRTRQIVLSGEVNKELAEKIVKQLFLMEAESDEPIYIFIDSPGGDADSGFAIFDMIRFVNAPVYTIGMGLVASAASLILLAADKDKRIALPNSHFLIHQPLSGIKGVATAIEIHAQEVEKLRKRINDLIVEETGNSLEEVEKHTDRDYWLNAEEAKEYGLVDRIIESRKDL